MPPSRVRKGGDAGRAAGWTIGLLLETMTAATQAETWGERLAIPRKGGGLHFGEPERREAAAAYARLGVLYEFVSLSSQLAERAEACRRLAAGRAAQQEARRPAARRPADPAAPAAPAAPPLPPLGRRGGGEAHAASPSRVHTPRRTCLPTR